MGKRLVKSPRTYVRDSGLLHALLGIGDLDALFGHPVLGARWEGFVIENLLAGCPPGTKASFYRTAAGAEMDLVLGARQGVWVIEIKRSASPGLQKGNHHALADIAPQRSFDAHGSTECFPMASNTEALSLPALAALRSLQPISLEAICRGLWHFGDDFGWQQRRTRYDLQWKPCFEAAPENRSSS